MEKTGARWLLGGAETVLRLRASGDFDAYWKLYIDREHAREHGARHAAGIPPLPIQALKPPLGVSNDGEACVPWEPHPKKNADRG